MEQEVGHGPEEKEQGDRWPHQARPVGWAVGSLGNFIQRGVGLAVSRWQPP